MFRQGSGNEQEQGQIIVLFALVIVVVLAFAALAVDLGVLRNNRQILRNTTDSAALAGGTLMPVTGAGPADGVATLVNSTIQKNYPSLRHSGAPIGARCVVGVDNANIAAGACDYTISFRCLIGADSSGPLIARDIPAACDPRPSLGNNLAGLFTGAGPTRSSSCNPFAGDRCNVVVVGGSSTTQYAFANVVGIGSGNSGAVSSAACGGPCGAAPPIINDVELVIDKSGSMNGDNSGSDPSCPGGCPRIFWAKKAANQLITDLASNGGIGPTGNEVGITQFSGTTTSGDTSSDPTAWTSTAAGLSAKINLINATGNTPTALGMQTATADLVGNARNPVGGTVKRVVIFLSDGRPNPDQGGNGQAATSATGQRPTQPDIDAYLGSADVAYSILLGNTPSPYPYTIGQGPPLSANINDPAMMQLLATPDDNTVTPPLTYYFHVVKASDLPSVFTQIAGQILGSGAHLIQLYPTPVVTSSSGPTTAVNITGQNFSGLTQVRIDGIPWTVVSSSDTSITVTHPGGSWTQGTPGTKADVIVTTSGGTSPITSAEKYTWPP
jgi:hypothetical protein